MDARSPAEQRTCQLRLGCWLIPASCANRESAPCFSTLFLVSWVVGSVFSLRIFSHSLSDLARLAVASNITVYPTPPIRIPAAVFEQLINYCPMETFYEDADGVLERAEEAKQEAGRACALDEARSYYDAIQHYDQAITVIDGILSTVSSNAAVWEKLVVYRQSYSDRMVVVGLFTCF